MKSQSEYLAMAEALEELAADYEGYRSMEVYALTMRAEKLRTQALSANAQWLPIESAPRDGTTILVCSGYWKATVHWHKHAQAWCTSRPSYQLVTDDEQPTHYMLLPPPPAALNPQEAK